MKRLLTAIAAAVLGISAQTTFAAWKEGVNTDGDGVRWNFRYDEEERVAYIQGAQYYGRTLRIPATMTLEEQYSVVLIEASAFSRFKDPLAATINNIVIPSSVAIIEQNAFEGCRSLTNLVIGSGVDEIQDEAFKDCFSLEEVTIPSNVSSILSGAFADCTSLTNVHFVGTASRFIPFHSYYFPKGMDFYSIFANTPYLARVNANDKFENAIDLGSALSGKISADNSIATLEDDEPDNAYSRSLWWKWTAPAGVTDVAFHTFDSHYDGDDCSIDISVFTGTELDNLYEMGISSCRVGSPAYVSFSVEPGETYYILVGDRREGKHGSGGRFSLSWKASNGFSFFVEDGVLLGCIGSRFPSDLVIPNNVIVICADAFNSNYTHAGCKDIDFITIPESVAVIGSCAFYGCWPRVLEIANCGLQYISDDAFWGACLAGGDDIILPDTVWYVAGGDVFGNQEGDLTVYAPDTVEEYLYSGSYGEEGTETELEVNYFPVPYGNYTEVSLCGNSDTADFALCLWDAEMSYYDDDDIECTILPLKRGETAWRDAISRMPSNGDYRFDGFWTAKTGGTQVWDHNMKYVGGTAYWTSDGKWKYSGEELVVYAHWQTASSSFTVTFNANGGTVSPTTRQVSSGAKIGTLPVPTLDGYDFVGWFTAKSGGTQVTATTTVSANVTYYAHWKAKTYTVSFNAISASATLSTKKKTVRYGGTYGALPTPELDGYAFIGWFTERSGGVQVLDTTKVTTAADHMLYARWKKAAATTTYTVSFNAISASATLSTKKKTVSYGGTYGALPVPELDGYDFVGWFTERSGGTQVLDTTKVTTAADHMLYARWKKASATTTTYTVTFSPNSTGATTTESTRKVAKGAKLGTLPTASMDGYDFVGWFTAKSGGTQVTSTTTVSANVTYYAHWQAKTYTVSFNAISASATLATKKKTVRYGGTYGALPVPGLDGYAFVGWFTERSGGTQVTDATKVTTAADHMLYARWKRK